MTICYSIYYKNYNKIVIKFKEMCFTNGCINNDVLVVNTSFYKYKYF